jgi:glycosyltransferase involved in cell wall biosynthesis
MAQAFGDVEVRVADQLFGVDVDREAIVVSRLCHPGFGWLPRYLQARGLRYAYFLDDNFWELDASVDRHIAPHFNNPAVMQTLDEFIAGAAVVLVMSKRLRDYVARRHPEARVEYIVPGVDLDRIAASAARLEGDSRPSGELRIAYPTSRRASVTELLVRVIEAMGGLHPDRVCFEFVGWAPVEIAGAKNVRVQSQIRSYDAYIDYALGRRWDIGIAPLIGSLFESFKTQVKYREYGALGVAGVYSAVAPYIDYIDDGVTGLLAENTVDSWVGALDRMIRLPELRASIAANAAEDVRRHYHQRDTADQIRRLLLEVVPAHA